LEVMVVETRLKSNEAIIRKAVVSRAASFGSNLLNELTGYLATHFSML